MAKSKSKLTQKISLPEFEDDSFLSTSEVPSWLNKDFIENVLLKHQKNVKVKSLRVEEIGGKGESFSSLMFRLCTHYYYKDQPKVEKRRSLIIKTLPTDDVSAEKLGPEMFNVQKKEMDIYQRVLPEFRRLLESINEDGNFYPMVLDADKVFDVIVMEDLLERSYESANRFTGLDLNHARITLRQIARMHAASVIVIEKDSTLLSKFNVGIFSRQNNICHVMFESMYDALIQEVATWRGYEQYAKKLETTRTNLIENGLRVFDCDEGDFHVLTHGDLWTNNILFSYHDDGTPKTCVLIDFQMSALASPAVDLLYFLFGSTNDDLRENSIDELLQFYYYELEDLLIKLGHNMRSFPTLQAFNMQISKKYFYALTTSLFEFAIMLTQDEDASFTNLMSTDEKAMNFKRRMFKDPRFQKNAKMMLPRLDAKGILDL